MTQGSTRTLGIMIKKFKTFITWKYIGLVRNKENNGFDKRLFQRNYYERIIRDEKELEKIRNYIVTNPQRWERDRNNPINITNHFN